MTRLTEQEVAFSTGAADPPPDAARAVVSRGGRVDMAEFVLENVQASAGSGPV